MGLIYHFNEIEMDKIQPHELEIRTDRFGFSLFISSQYLKLSVYIVHNDGSRFDPFKETYLYPSDLKKGIYELNDKHIGYSVMGRITPERISLALYRKNILIDSKYMLLSLLKIALQSNCPNVVEKVKQ